VQVQTLERSQQSSFRVSAPDHGGRSGHALKAPQEWSWSRRQERVSAGPPQALVQVQTLERSQQSSFRVSAPDHGGRSGHALCYGYGHAQEHAEASWTGRWSEQEQVLER